MKKIKLALVALLFPLFTFSQGGVELVPFAGYMFGGSLNFVEGKLNLDNGMNYGLSILVPVQTLVDVELNYTRMDSKASFSPYWPYTEPPYNYEYHQTDLATNYFHIGAISKFYTRDTKAQPFGSFSLGATWFQPKETSTYPDGLNFGDVWKFSVNLGLGVKIMFSDRVGIMLRGRLMMPMTFGGGSFYVGTGGSGFALGTWIAPLQGDFNGGLIIKLGN